VTITFDPNVRPLLMGNRDETLPRIEELVAAADVVKASAEDIEWLHPGVDPEAVAKRWLRQGPALVVVTLGEDGVLAVGRAAGVIRRPAVPVGVVDTVGAGDSFMSALLTGLADAQLLGGAHRERLGAAGVATVVSVLDQAALAAALTCGRPGADPPTRADLDRAAARRAAGSS